MLLDSYRVLDLADEQGMLCGKLLGDMGADVIKIERPGGDPSRRMGPFFHDDPRPEKSLPWMAYNNNKRGITLDIEEKGGQELFSRLVETADFVIESFPPGYMDSLGIGFTSLSQINPRLVMASITPFGQKGPHSNYKASDLVAWAMGGQLFLSGDTDRPPVHVSFPQAYLNGSIQGAAGIMIAHYYREVTGQGQHLDVSIQESVSSTLMNARQYWDISKVLLRRSGGYRQGHARGALIRSIWQCRDGYVNITIMGGTMGLITIVPLVKWMAEEGAADEFLLSRDWRAFDATSATQELFDNIEAPVSRFLMRFTASELYLEAVKRSFILYPVNKAGEILADQQLASRGFFEQIDHPELGTSLTYPGTFFESSETKGKIRRRAPLIGEHNQEILHGELDPLSARGNVDASGKAYSESQAAGREESGKKGGGAFEGIRVVDFTWAVAGPMTTRYLSDHGAQVIKVESMTKIDPLRTGTPFRNNKSTVNGSAYFTNTNRGKYSLGLNLRNPRGVELARKLIETADVVAENYTPGVMESWGLGYTDLKKIKPDIIMFSTSQQGQTGPLARHPALGNSLVSLAGITHITGWPDRSPVGPYGAYPDYTAPPLGAALIAAALAYRRKTGKGQYLDLSQYEANLHLVAPVLLDYSANGREKQREGNRCEYAAPQGVYRCLGDDRWCAISVLSEEEWKAFCGVLRNPDWTHGARFSTLSERKRNEDELDLLVESWTSARSPEEVMMLMQAAGVAAGVVQSPEDLHNDVHLKSRRYLRMLDHPEIGVHAHDSPPFQLSQTPANLDRSAPLLGEHNEYVCHDLLGIPDEEFVDLLATGVLEQV